MTDPREQKHAVMIERHFANMRGALMAGGDTAAQADGKMACAMLRWLGELCAGNDTPNGPRLVGAAPMVEAMKAAITDAAEQATTQRSPACR